MPPSKLATLAAVLAAAVLPMRMASAEDAPAGRLDARLTFTERYAIPPDTPEGAPTFVTALGIRGPAEASRAALDVVVLVDTSATQVGDHRLRSLAALEGLLSGVRLDDRLLIAAVDVSLTPLQTSFATAGEEAVTAAVRTVASRTPLGSTDIVAALATAADRLDDSVGHRTIIYIGNGPALAATDIDEFADVIDALRARRVSVSSLGVGPHVNWPFLAALANATGGAVVVPAADENARDAGAHIAGLAAVPVTWLQAVMLEPTDPNAAWRVLPARMPPLRSDRDAVVLAVSPAPLVAVSLQAPAADTLQRLPVPDGPPRDDNAYLAELARNAWSTAGLFLPVLGSEGLEVAHRVIREEAAMLATLSRQAEAAGARDSALRLATASLRRDPDNPVAAVMLTAARRQEPAAELPPPPAGAEGDADTGELADLAAMRRVRAQQLEQETAVRVREARQLLSLDPDQARELLKTALNEVRESGDLDAASRDRLLRQLEMRIRESIVRSREKVGRDLAAERRAAIGREQARLTADLQRREERIRQLVERYNALVEQGIREGYAQPESYPAVIGDEAVVGLELPTRAFVEAERVVGEEIAKEAPELWANHPIPMTARVVGRTAPLVARILHYDAQNVRTRRDQERGFMDVLHLVDVAAIPFPDEPPIIYPTPARWREITASRSKYKSGDLSTPSETEKTIYENLDRSVSRTFDFQDTPLRAVITQLQDEFGIPIVPDMKALDDAGIDLDATTVTQKVSGIKLRSALRLLLGNADLTYMVKNEVLLITTKQVAEENLVVKVYPVGDLVLPVNPNSGVNPFQMGGGLGGANSVNSGMGGGIPGGGAGGMGGGMGGMGGFCWVAREVYGPHDPRWLVFRGWITTEAPGWLRAFYAAHGADVADWLRDKPTAKRAVRWLMDRVVQPRLAALTVEGAHCQVMEAKARLTGRERAGAAGESRSGTDIDLPGPTADGPRATRAGGGGLPADVLDATDLQAAIASYLADEPAASGAAANDRAERRARLRESTAALGRQGNYGRAAELIAAAITAGSAEPWMYESLALALEMAGKPRADVERALLSSADFATSTTELLQLANYLARFGADAQAINVCRRATRLDPTNREAFALAMTLAARSDDAAALRWSCAGVLAHEWPAEQRDIAARARRLANATMESLSAGGKPEDAAAFRAAIDRAGVRDLVIDITWTGDADVDLLVEEPPGTVCTAAAPRSSSGGVLLADGAADERSGDPHGQTDAAHMIHRERYVAAQAFPGTYRVLVRRTAGTVAADTVTAETIVHRGTPDENRQRKQIPLGAEDSLIVIELGAGRRMEPLFDAQVAQDVVAQQQVGRAVLAQQLASLSDPATARSLAESRGAGPGSPQFPFFGAGGAVGNQPVISTLPEGVNLFARAVVSADRRYVRVTSTPLFSGVGNVTTFSFTGGGGGMGGMGGGGMGGMGGGGMGGGGMGGGGMGGGMGGMGNMGMGAMGACWVAREVFGPENSRWVEFRAWLMADAPTWLRDVYLARGEAFAAWIHDKPALKTGLRFLMNFAIDSRSPPVQRP